MSYVVKLTPKDPGLHELNQIRVIYKDGKPSEVQYEYTNPGETPGGISYFLKKSASGNCVEASEGSWNTQPHQKTTHRIEFSPVGCVATDEFFKNHDPQLQSCAAVDRYVEATHGKFASAESAADSLIDLKQRGVAANQIDALVKNCREHDSDAQRLINKMIAAKIPMDEYLTIATDKSALNRLSASYGTLCSHEIKPEDSKGLTGSFDAARAEWKALNAIGSATPATPAGGATSGATIPGH